VVQNEKGTPIPVNGPLTPSPGLTHDAHDGPCPVPDTRVPETRKGPADRRAGNVPILNYTKAEMQDVMRRVFEECGGLREAGQKEYAHADQNSFANFDRVAERLGLSRESVLMVYAEKHVDGIHSWIQGHRSQRESVKGRIRDVIVYMCLLYGMVECRERAEAGEGP
jgi:hypothetical protein